jgi:hypothetical protein
MAHSTERIFKIETTGGALGDEGREGTDGRILPVYSIEAGGSGRAYTIGDSVGRYTIAGAEL